MKLLFMLIISLFVMSSSFAEEIRAELSLITPPSILKEGDIVGGLLKVWPIENADLDEFKKIESMSLANALYITEIESVDVSANNADVVEAKLIMIVKRANAPAPFDLNYKGQNIRIQIPPLNIAPAEQDSSEYYVMDQGTFYSNIGKIMAALVLLVSLFALFFKRKNILGFVQKLKSDPIATARKKFDEKFTKANSREEYEEIYALRREWLGHTQESLALKNFFEVLQMHQYKKSWSDSDLEEVQKAFDFIRRSFK